MKLLNCFVGGTTSGHTSEMEGTFKELIASINSYPIQVHLHRFTSILCAMYFPSQITILVASVIVATAILLYRAALPKPIPVSGVNTVHNTETYHN